MDDEIKITKEDKKEKGNFKEFLLSFLTWVGLAVFLLFVLVLIVRLYFKVLLY